MFCGWVVENIVMNYHLILITIHYKTLSLGFLAYREGARNSHYKHDGLQKVLLDGLLKELRVYLEGQ